MDDWFSSHLRSPNSAIDGRYNWRTNPVTPPGRRIRRSVRHSYLRSGNSNWVLASFSRIPLGVSTYPHCLQQINSSFQFSAIQISRRDSSKAWVPTCISYQLKTAVFVEQAQKPVSNTCFKKECNFLPAIPTQIQSVIPNSSISNGMTLVQDLRQDTFRTKLRIFLGINICKHYP